MTRKSVVMLLITIAIAATASAQMMGGPGTGGGMGGGFTHRGSMPSINIGAMQGMQMTLPVAEDGTVFVARKATYGYELAAIRPSGAVAWNWNVENLNVATMELVGTNLVVGFHTVTTSNTPAVAGKLVALSIASGAQQWSVDLDGFAMALTAHDAGVYALVVKPTFQTRTGAGMGYGMGMTRSLVSVGNDGAIAFTMLLN
ncbi:MAG: hypothetical protein ACYC7A_17705 [Thermoanaerobaculia bacterium]